MLPADRPNGPKLQNGLRNPLLHPFCDGKAAGLQIPKAGDKAHMSFSFNLTDYMLYVVA